MRTSELAAKLQQWARECSSVSEQECRVPDKLWMFLASRISELGVVETDLDVVTARTPHGHRKVRVTGVQAGMLVCDFADGSQGCVLVRADDVSQEDRGKLTDVLDNLGV